MLMAIISAVQLTFMLIGEILRSADALENPFFAFVGGGELKQALGGMSIIVQSVSQQQASAAGYVCWHLPLNPLPAISLDDILLTAGCVHLGRFVAEYACAAWRSKAWLRFTTLGFTCKPACLWVQQHGGGTVQ